MLRECVAVCCMICGGRGSEKRCLLGGKTGGGWCVRRGVCKAGKGD